MIDNSNPKVQRLFEEIGKMLRENEVQPPQADMVQPLVGPPDAGQLIEEPAALARRLILAELRTFVKYEHESVDFIPTDSMYVDGARDAYDTVLERLEMLLGTEGQDAP